MTGGTITKITGQNFAVQAELMLEAGGTGTIYFVGTLSHEEFPFTIFGEILQMAPSP